MAGTFKLHAINQAGFHVELSGDFPDEYNSLQIMVTDPDFGFKPTIGSPAPASSAGSVSHSGTPGLTCQFCGKQVQGVKYGGKVYSPEQIARSRSEKMGKMGKDPAPVCSDCWTGGGHNKAWDAYYQANR